MLADPLRCRPGEVCMGKSCHISRRDLWKRSTKIVAAEHLTWTLLVILPKHIGKCSYRCSFIYNFKMQTSWLWGLLNDSLQKHAPDLKKNVFESFFMLSPPKFCKETIWCLKNWKKLFLSDSPMSDFPDLNLSLSNTQLKGFLECGQ